MRNIEEILYSLTNITVEQVQRTAIAFSLLFVGLFVLLGNTGYSFIATLGIFTLSYLIVKPKQKDGRKNK